MNLTHPLPGERIPRTSSKLCTRCPPSSYSLQISHSLACVRVRVSVGRIGLDRQSRGPTGGRRGVSNAAEFPLCALPIDGPRGSNHAGQLTVPIGEAVRIEGSWGRESSRGRTVRCQLAGGNATVKNRGERDVFGAEEGTPDISGRGHSKGTPLKPPWI